MHDKLQPFEADIKWFKSRCIEKGIQYKNDFAEAFAERVAIKTSCGHLSVDKARNDSFEEINEQS